MKVRGPGTQNQQSEPVRSAAEHVLDWIQQYIAGRDLRPGDALPK